MGGRCGGFADGGVWMSLTMIMMVAHSVYIYLSDLTRDNQLPFALYIVCVFIYIYIYMLEVT